MSHEIASAENRLDRGTVALSGFFALISLYLLASPRGVVDLGFAAGGLIWAKALWDSRYQTPGRVKP